MSVYPSATQPQWQSYVDLTYDVKPFLQWPAGVSPQDSLLQDTIDAACWWVQDYLGKPIAPTTFFQRFDGYSGFGGSMIDLPYYPVLGVPTVVEYWGASGSRTDTSCSTTVNSQTVLDSSCQSGDKGAFVTGPGFANGATVQTVNPGVSFTVNTVATQTATGVSLVLTRGHQLTLQTPSAQGGSDMFQLDALEGIITRTYLGLLQRQFFPGKGNVEVTWTAGYNPVPPVWKRGTLRLIKHWWDHDFQALAGFQSRDTAGDDYRPDVPLVPDSIMQVFTSATQVGLA